MSRKKPRKKKGVSRFKLGLIAVLGLVFVGVWGNALLGGKGKSEPIAKAETKPRAAARRPDPAQKPAPAKAAERAEAKPRLDWQAIPLADAVLNDPFSKPVWAITRKPASSANANRAAPRLGSDGEPLDLEDMRASLIMIAGASKVATVGDRDLRIGDEFEGFRVVDINERGVVLGELSSSQ